MSGLLVPPLPAGPPATRAMVAALGRARGSFADGELRTGKVGDVRLICPALYLVVALDGLVWWLGKAAGANGVRGRMATHLGEGWKRQVFHRVVIAPMVPNTPRAALAAAEGYASDLSGLRDLLTGRTFPPSAGWYRLCGPGSGVGPLLQPPS